MYPSSSRDLTGRGSADGRRHLTSSSGWRAPQEDEDTYDYPQPSTNAQMSLTGDQAPTGFDYPQSSYGMNVSGTGHTSPLSVQGQRPQYGTQAGTVDANAALRAHFQGSSSQFADQSWPASPNSMGLPTPPSSVRNDGGSNYSSSPQSIYRAYPGSQAASRTVDISNIRFAGGDFARVTNTTQSSRLSRAQPGSYSSQQGLYGNYTSSGRSQVPSSQSAWAIAPSTSRQYHEDPDTGGQGSGGSGGNSPIPIGPETVKEIVHRCAICGNQYKSQRQLESHQRKRQHY